jgi:hypothetical protein
MDTINKQIEFNTLDIGLAMHSKKGAVPTKKAIIKNKVVTIGT